MLKSNTVLEEVIKELNLPMTPDDIRQILTAGAIDKTEAFEIGVTYENAEMAQRIVNAIIDTAPKEIVRVVQAGGVEVIDYAKIPDKPSSPNLVLNTVVGAVIGLVVSFGICVIFTFFDTKIRKEEDLTEIFTIPVLGSIPTLVEH